MSPTLLSPAQYMIQSKSLWIPSSLECHDSSEFAPESKLPSEQLAMEEGTSFSFSPTASVASESLSITDSITVSVSEAADSASDAVADSLDQTRTPALDRFLGHNFAQSPRYSGTKLQSFKPKSLKFFEFVVLTFVVHRRFSHYTKLRKNCIFYASLIYASAERYGGNINPGSENNHPNIGRWRGLKVTKIDSDLVSDIVKRFKRVLAQQLSTFEKSSNDKSKLDRLAAIVNEDPQNTLRHGNI